MLSEFAPSWPWLSIPSLLRSTPPSSVLLQPFDPFPLIVPNAQAFGYIHTFLFILCDVIVCKKLSWKQYLILLQASYSFQSHVPLVYVFGDCIYHILRLLYAAFPFLSLRIMFHLCILLGIHYIWFYILLFPLYLPSYPFFLILFYGHPLVLFLLF